MGNSLIVLGPMESGSGSEQFSFIHFHFEHERIEYIELPDDDFLGRLAESFLHPRDRPIRNPEASLCVLNNCQPLCRLDRKSSIRMSLSSCQAAGSAWILRPSPS